MTDTTTLSHEELLRLWQHGRRIAASCCAPSLRALLRGLGGFYEVDDLWQDLFLEFWDVARRWYGGSRPASVDDLWAAWRYRLRHGGYIVLHRRPQRLWRRREWSVDPDAMELDPLAGDDPAPLTPSLTPTALEALIEADPEAACIIDATREEVARRLQSVSATNRQTLYLTAVVGLSATEAARCLQLADAADVRRRVYRAREAVRRGNAGRAEEGRP